MFFQPHTSPAYHYDDDDIYFDVAPGELAGIGSFFKKIGKGVLKVGKIAAPVAAGFIPGVGAFASAGVSAAIGALDARNAGKGNPLDAANQVSSALDQLAIAPMDASNADAIAAQAEQLASSLSTVQAKKKNDRQNLQNLQNSANSKAQQIRARANQVKTDADNLRRQTAVVGGSNSNAGIYPGGGVYQDNTGSDFLGGMDSSKILLIGGVALGAIFLLKK